MVNKSRKCASSQPLARSIVVAVVVGCLTLSGCAAAMLRTPPPEVTRGQHLAGLPYSPLVYHLDLSVLAYQLYSQSLVWPFDPYYEEFADQGGKRDQFMKRVRVWARATGVNQVRTRPRFGGYRGPGMLAGFADNPRSDPTLYRYDKIYPWRPAISNPSGRWTEYTPPDEITGQIRDVYMCYRRTGRPEGDVAVAHVVSDRGAAYSGARDVLLAFEGGTGDKGELGQAASQSLMGFVLLRFLPGSGAYDVHIAFRGSRSGSVARAALKANFTAFASGNPDWITDLGWFRIGPEEGASTITTTGQVHRGFATAMTQTLPQAFACLDRGARLARGQAPRNVYVTGHSLGGGLAQHFVSAVILGNRYGPDGAGQSMPARLMSWPWANIKLISYGAPTAGDPLWAGTLTEKALQSEFFNTVIEPIDLKALAVHDPSILPRLVDPMRPAGYRVLISTDPVTTEKVTGGRHVGKTVYANKLGLLAPFAVAKLRSHEPELIRTLMLKSFDDPRNPPTVIRYRNMTELNPDFDSAARGTIAEFAKLLAALENYYAGSRHRFDVEDVRRDFEIYRSLVSGE